MAGYIVMIAVLFGIVLFLTLPEQRGSQIGKSPKSNNPIPPPFLQKEKE